LHVTVFFVNTLKLGSYLHLFIHVFQFKGNIYRVELMHYLLFHALNQADLPDDIDVYWICGRRIDLNSSQ
jgi:hypothetical protein